MKIALACPYAWDAPGGVQVHVRQLAERMLDRGHEVLVLAPSAEKPDDPFVISVGAPVRVRFNRSVAPIAPWPRSARRVREELTSFRPDVVHAHEPFVPGAGMAAVRSGAAPSVATFHAYADRAPLMAAARPLLHRVWKRIGLRIAVSEAAADFVGRRFPRDPVRVVPNGVEVEPFAAAEPARLPAGRRMLFVNRLDPRKGFSVMIRAFAQMARARDDVILVVAGDGAERDALRLLSPEARARVVMLGNVPHDRLPPYHAGCEVFCAPARGRESFGIVLVEAMAAGLPVVVSDIPGYREVVRDGVEGLLVPAGSAERLAEAVGRLLDDADLGKRLGEAGRARSARYSWDAVADEIESCYREVVDGG